MLLTKVSQSVVQKTVKPIQTGIMRKLRVPVLTAAMVLGGALVSKAQTNIHQDDVFEQTTNIVNDSIKDKSNINILNDTVPDDKTYPDTLVNINKKISENKTLDFQVVVENPSSLDASETAAEDLYTKVMASIANSGDNPYSSLYLALSESRENTEDAAYGTMSYLDDQLDDLTENLKEYNRNHKEEINELMESNGSITEFHYGKDKSKTGTLFQTLNISGIGQKNKNKSENDTISNNNGKGFMGDVAYRLKAVTDKAEVETNIHAGSDNVDLQLAAAYRTNTKNGGNFALTLNGRETMTVTKLTEV